MPEPRSACQIRKARNPKASEARKALAKVRLQERRKPERPPTPFKPGLRLGEVRKLLYARYDALECDYQELRILLHCVAAAVKPQNRIARILSEIKDWAPHISGERAHKLAITIALKPITWGADKLAQALFVTTEERDRLDLRTIGAYDMTKAERTARTNQRKRERDKASVTKRRRADGRHTREDYRTAHISALKPWVFEGVNRRTWERNGQTVNGLALALLCSAQMHAAGVSPHIPALECICDDTPAASDSCASQVVIFPGSQAKSGTTTIDRQGLPWSTPTMIEEITDPVMIARIRLVVDNVRAAA